MKAQSPIFVSDGEVTLLEKEGTLLAINVGSKSPFANEPPRDPWAINDDIVGATPYSLWFGMTQVVGRNLQQQFTAGVEIVEWIAIHMQDPFSTIPTNQLPEKFQKYFEAYEKHEERLETIAQRANISLINGLYFVASQVSEDARVLSAQYKILPHNRVDFSIVYNPEWGKMSIGANTIGPMPHGSSAMLVWLQLDKARQMYAANSKIYLPTALNLDVLTAAMLAQGYNLPFEWIKYVEALKLGNFSSRLNKRLPDLTQVGNALSHLEKKEKWGGSSTFQGSPRGIKTAVTSVQKVLEVMADIFPKADMEASLLTIRRGNS